MAGQACLQEWQATSAGTKGQARGVAAGQLPAARPTQKQVAVVNIGTRSFTSLKKDCILLKPPIYTDRACFPSHLVYLGVQESQELVVEKRVRVQDLVSRLFCLVVLG